MQANLQSTTFNKHNYIKNDLINHRKNPYVNNISQDLTYKSHSITDAARNPLHVSAGDDYLYYKRIEQLKRKLNQRQMTLKEYEQAVTKIQVSMKINPVVGSHALRRKSVESQPKNKMHLEATSKHELKPKERTVDQMTDKEVIKMINEPPKQPSIDDSETNVTISTNEPANDNESDDE